MRFRFGFPVLQSVAMFIFMWAPWVPGGHKFDIVLRDGTEFKGWTLLPDWNAFDSVVWAQGLNLPALPAEIPIDLASEKWENLGVRTFRFFSFWFWGILVWYLIGRLVDDLIRWRSFSVLPRRQWGDLAFAVEAMLVAMPSFLSLAFERSAEFLVVRNWSAVWVLAASTALAVRLLQFVRHRNRPAHS